MPLTAPFEDRVAAVPDEPFLVTLERTFTYGEAGRAVAAVRHELSAMGISAGDRVLLLARNGPEFVFGWLALAGLDATMVPLHRQLPAAGKAAVARDVGARFIIGSADAMDGHAQWSAIGPEHSLVLDDRLEPGSRPGLAAVAIASHPCSILYTSGTTGPPKGVVLSHASYLAAAHEMCTGIKVRASDRILTALPLYHANPQFYAVATALVSGAAVALLDRFQPATFMRDAARLEATAFTYVGTILAMLALAGGGDPDHPVRYCVGGGAPADHWQTLQENWGLRVHELYGSTETGSFATLNTTAHYRQGSCGRSRSDMQLAIVDENDVELPVGQTGEVVVRPVSPGVLYDGYFNQAEITVRRNRNLWFHTGDRGRLDEDGYLYFAGRVDDRIRRGGENIDPRSVEEALLAHPAVREVAVVGVEDDVMGQEVKAVVVAGEDFDPRALTQVLEGRLPRLAWPRYIETRDQLPKTATEKIAIGALREPQPSLVDLRASTTAVQTTADPHGGSSRA